MNTLFYCMNTQFYPQTTEKSQHEYYDVRILPTELYPFGKATDLFFALFLARMKTLERTATDITINTHETFEGDEPLLIRIRARLGGMDYVESYFYLQEEDFDDDLIDVLPDGIPKFRRVEPVSDKSDWDSIHREWDTPFDREHYENAIKEFLEGKYINDEETGEMHYL